MATHQKIHPVYVEETAWTPNDSIRSENVDQIDHFPSNLCSDDHPRIHPVEVEASSSAPLAPSNSFRSEKGDPVEQIAPSDTAILAEDLEAHRERSSLCRFICWTLIVLFILIILLAITVGILFLFHPKIPKYSVDNISINDFTLYPNMTIYASFNVAITAINRNKKIGIYYDGGSMSVWYTSTRLCDGSLPVFYQRPHNTTVMVVVLTGNTQYGSILMRQLLELQQTGRIPLDLKTSVPVRVKLGELKIKVRFKVRCNLVVNSLSANNLVSIRTSSCKFKYKL